MKRAEHERPFIPVMTDNRRETGQEDSPDGPDGRVDGLPADAAVIPLAAQQPADGQPGAVALPPMLFPGPFAYGHAPRMLEGENAPAAPPALSVQDAEPTSLVLSAVKPLRDEPAFVHAARLGLQGVVREWLDDGIDVNLSHQQNGGTALMAASRSGHPEVVRHLLAQPGIKLDLLNADGHSALTLAVCNNRSKVVRCLLDAGADVNLPMRKSRKTALMIAAEEGCPDSARILLGHHRIDPDRCDADGRTALMFAAGSNQPDIVEWLLMANASAVRLDRYDDSAFSYAFDERHAAVIEVLFRHGKQRDPGLDPEDSLHYPKSFSAAVGDLWLDRKTPDPALPAVEASEIFFNGLSDQLTRHKKMAGKMLAWLIGNGMRWAYAHQIVDVLCKPKASWQAPGASRQQKLIYCLSAIGVLPALDGAGKVHALYREAGISKSAVERLGGVAASQLTGQADMANRMLAGIGSELMSTLVDDCMASIGLNGTLDSEKLSAVMLDNGYCAPVAQAIATSWQDTVSILREKPVSAPAGATFDQLAALLQAVVDAHAPALFAETLARHLASHTILHELGSLQHDGIDEGLHAQFQIQCDQLKQLCAQLLDKPARGTASAAKH